MRAIVYLVHEMKNRMRLDQFLAENDLAASRSRARDMIVRGCVKVNGVVAKKHSQMVSERDELEIDDPSKSYVSRAALKLIAGLEAADINPSGCDAVDLGASTGGFTQVLLERGVRHVTAIDVGHGQLDKSLLNHPRITLLEKLNARNLVKKDLGTRTPNLIVSDLSFVSITLAAEPALLLAAENAVAVLLVKPQFEVGRDGIGKGGIVTDKNLIELTLSRITNWFNNLDGWQVTGLTLSPIKGGDGNQEYLLCGRRGP